jgi:hypothetical protein
MAEDQDPLEDAPDPTEDTPDDDSEDTADDQPEGSIDWEARYKEAQKAIAKQGRELAAFRQSEPDESDEDEPDDEDEPTEVEAPAEQYERDSWKLAESLYGEEAIDAYTAAEKLTRKATTPADWVAAFEAYHEIRSGKRRAEPDPAPADGRKSRDKAVEPRVDNNRSDQAPDLTQDFEEARKSGSLDAFTRAATAALGLGPKKRS